VSAKRKMSTAEFKREAVSLITDHGDGVSEAARNLGRHANRLRKWKRTLAQEGANAFPGTVASARIRKNCIVCGKKTRVCGWSERS
jgi:transposase-like protein